MKPAKRFVFLTLFLCFSFLAISQENTKVDSLTNLLKNTEIDTIKAKLYLAIGEVYKLTNPTKNKEYADLAQKIYQQYGDQKGVAATYYAKYTYFFTIGKIDSANYYLDESISKLLVVKDTLQAVKQQYNKAYGYVLAGNFDKADSLIHQITPIYIKFNDSITLARTYILKGIIAGSKGFGNIALEEYLKSLKIYRNKKEKLRIAEAVFSIGVEYQQAGNHEKAIGFFKENLEIAEEMNIPQYVAQSSNFIGISYIELNKLKEAEEFLNNSLKKSEEIGFKYNIGKTYVNLGQLNFRQKKYSEATQNLLNGDAIFKAMKIPTDQAGISIILGKILHEKKDYKQAIAKYDEAIATAKIIKDADVLKSSYEYKSITLEAQGNAQRALDVFKKSKALNDSIFTLKNSQRTKELQIIHETELKEQRIAQQETEITLLEEKEKVSRLQKMALGGGLGLSALVLGFGFYGFRQKTKRNRLEKEKIDAELAFKKSELDFKKKELTTQALQLAKKNETLESLKQKANELKTSEVKNGYQQLITAINFDLQDDNNWQNFARYFEEVHKDFNSNVAKKYPEITPNELRLIALLKMNLSSKEIANILNISIPGIKKARQRLRKKMQLSSTDSLENAVLSI